AQRMLASRATSSKPQSSLLDTQTCGTYSQKFGLKATTPLGARRAPAQATLAQLVEHSIRNRKVVGSNPTGGSISVVALRCARARRASANVLQSRIITLASPVSVTTP